MEIRDRQGSCRGKAEEAARQHWGALGWETAELSFRWKKHRDPGGLEDNAPQ